MHPPLRFVFCAAAALALVGCGQDPPPPPPSETPSQLLARLLYGAAGECAHADVLAFVAQEAGVPVEQASEPVQTAIAGLNAEIHCDEAVGHAWEAIYHRYGRTARPPPATVEESALMAARFLARVHR
jgi:hypothetical protein